MSDVSEAQRVSLAVRLYEEWVADQDAIDPEDVSDWSALEDEDRDGWLAHVAVIESEGWGPGALVDYRAENKRVVEAIGGLQSCAKGENPFGDAYSLGFDTARRLALRIAKGAPVDTEGPRSSEHFAVHQTGPTTWAIQRKPIPGFKLGDKPGQPRCPHCGASIEAVVLGCCPECREVL